MKQTISIETTTDEHGNTTTALLVPSRLHEREYGWIPEPGSDARKRQGIPDDRTIIPSIRGRVELEMQRLYEAEKLKVQEEVRRGKPLMWHLEGSPSCVHVQSPKYRKKALDRILPREEFEAKFTELQCTACHTHLHGL